jgi:hypothetical protein
MSSINEVNRMNRLAISDSQFTRAFILDLEDSPDAGKNRPSKEDQVALDRMLVEMDAIGRNGGIVVLPAGRRENISAGEPMLKTLKARKTR